jgi:hypothetical protein
MSMSYIIMMLLCTQSMSDNQLNSSNFDKVFIKEEDIYDIY